MRCPRPRRWRRSEEQLTRPSPSGEHGCCRRRRRRRPKRLLKPFAQPTRRLEDRSCEWSPPRESSHPLVWVSHPIGGEEGPGRAPMTSGPPCRRGSSSTPPDLHARIRSGLLAAVLAGLVLVLFPFVTTAAAGDHSAPSQPQNLKVLAVTQTIGHARPGTRSTDDVAVDRLQRLGVAVGAQATDEAAQDDAR